MGRTQIEMLGVEEKIMELRIASGIITIKELAERAEASYTTVHSFVHGYCIHWSTIEKILSVLNASEEDTNIIRNAWIKSKAFTPMEAKGPLWAQELQQKMDEILELLRNK